MIRSNELGKEYADGERIVAQGDKADCMFFVQKGEVEVFLETDDGPVHLSVLGAGDIFGEMSLFTLLPRSASVAAKGKARVLTLDKRGFLRRIHEDPSLAFRMLKNLSERIIALNEEVSALKQALSDHEDRNKEAR